MKAVILAAGKGTRISTVTGGRCKSLLAFAGQTILDRQIDAAFAAGVDSLAIVVGHQKEQIIEHVAQSQGARISRIAFIYNPEFGETNNMYSLWKAKRWLAGSGFACLNADVLCHPKIVRAAVAAQADISVLIDREYREETTKVQIEGDRVIALHKSIPATDSDGTFVNIARFSASGAATLFEEAERRFAEGKRNQFYNDVLHALACSVPVGFTDIGALPWAEIDDAHDLQYAQTHVLPQIAAVEQAV